VRHSTTKVSYACLCSGVFSYHRARNSLDPADLHQEADIATWLACWRFDPERASLPTYLNHVVRNRIAGLRIAEARRLRGYRGVPLNCVVLTAAPQSLDLRLDVARVLAAMSAHDRLVARYRGEHSPTAAKPELGMSRAAVYRAITRLRTAFVAAGYHDARCRSGQTKRRSGAANVSLKEDGNDC
jgi:DNA-directed RNA polymerase specialized sigma24 family protein